MPLLHKVFKGNGVNKRVSEELASLNQWFEDNFQCEDGPHSAYFEEPVVGGYHRHIYVAFALGVQGVDTASRLALVLAMRDSFEGLVRMHPDLRGRRLWFRSRFNLTEDDGKTKLYGRLCIDGINGFPEIYIKDEGHSPRELPEHIKTLILDRVFDE